MAQIFRLERARQAEREREQKRTEVNGRSQAGQSRTGPNRTEQDKIIRKQRVE